ncbi:hypothetical protein GDO78_013525 [Eleutherodactylus coqui]|uniref:Uncharacterized protein n=1 Tax=Eleutherodactylus coqui TaxID=57060 RepID=A0A8J6K445_ELECQ|nr:hypothetical protein GDO78_013525 [Eleutherodactylus coqui]
MALSPVSEESSNYEEVLHKSNSLSSASNYSGDSFESSTDKSHGRYDRDSFDSVTNENIENDQSDSFESFAGESSRRQRTDSFCSISNDSGRSYEGDSFESLPSELDVHRTYSSKSSYVESVPVDGDHKENEQGKVLIEKWIKTLVDGNLWPNHLFQHPLKTGAHKESTGRESKALKSYCALKIDHLRQPSNRHRQNKDQPPKHPGKVISIHQACPVPRELMNRLELQCIKETVSQVIRTEMHDPATCPDCLDKQAELAQCQFIRMKKTKLEADLLQKKMEEHSHSKDLVTCIGEMLQSLPKPSEERTAIWQRLNVSVTKT